MLVPLNVLECMQSLFSWIYKLVFQIYEAVISSSLFIKKKKNKKKPYFLFHSFRKTSFLFSGQGFVNHKEPMLFHQSRFSISLSFGTFYWFLSKIHYLSGFIFFFSFQQKKLFWVKLHLCLQREPLYQFIWYRFVETPCKSFKYCLGEVFISLKL